MKLTKYEQEILDGVHGLGTQFRECVAWSESNAVNFVNSVVGARAERLPDMVDVECAVTGRVPAYGWYLDENRLGDVLFVLEGFDDKWFQDSVDYAILGYLIGCHTHLLMNLYRSPG